MLPRGVLPQSITSSSGALAWPEVAGTSNGWAITRDCVTPGFGPSIQAMFRCAILSEVAESAPPGIGVSSYRISAIRHWCGEALIRALIDFVPVQGPSHWAAAVGGASGRKV